MKPTWNALTGIAVAGILTLTAGCSSDDSPTGASSSSQKVNATAGNTFSPNSVTITAGQSVGFVFAAVTHNVTFNAATGVPANIDNSNNKTVTRTFSTAGTFTYVCTLHSGMSGTIIVSTANTNVNSGY